MVELHVVVEVVLLVMLRCHLEKVVMGKQILLQEPASIGVVAAVVVYIAQEIMVVKVAVAAVVATLVAADPLIALV